MGVLKLFGLKKNQNKGTRIRSSNQFRLFALLTTLYRSQEVIGKGWLDKLREKNFRVENVSMLILWRLDVLYLERVTDNDIVCPIICSIFLQIEHASIYISLNIIDYFRVSLIVQYFTVNNLLLFALKSRH